jgi:hypothetical protein
VADPEARPLPRDFLEALEGEDELLVSSCEDGRERTVRMWFAIAPGGVVLLFTWAFSLKAERWRRRPWTRLRIPGTSHSVEGRVKIISPDEVKPLADLVMARWADWGVTHPEGLRRMIEGGTHVLLRVEGIAAEPASQPER